MQRKTKRAGNGYNESIGETFCEIRKEKGKIKKKKAASLLYRDPCGSDGKQALQKEKAALYGKLTCSQERTSEYTNSTRTHQLKKQRRRTFKSAFGFK